MTIDGEGGRRGPANADNCWRGERGCLQTPKFGWRNTCTAPYVGGWVGKFSCFAKNIKILKKLRIKVCCGINNWVCCYRQWPLATVNNIRGHWDIALHCHGPKKPYLAHSTIKLKYDFYSVWKAVQRGVKESWIALVSSISRSSRT